METKPQILICDDESHILHIISLKLSSAGYTPITATRGQEALTLAQKNPPAMVITDYHMPGMNGLELCRELRRQSETSKVDLVLVTARGANLPPEELEPLGLSAIFNKPFSPHELLAHVAKQIPLRQRTIRGGRA